MLLDVAGMTIDKIANEAALRRVTLRHAAAGKPSGNTSPGRTIKAEGIAFKTMLTARNCRYKCSGEAYPLPVAAAEAKAAKSKYIAAETHEKTLAKGAGSKLFASSAARRREILTCPCRNRPG